MGRDYYAPAMLSSRLGWVWRQVGTGKRLHLVTPEAVTKPTTACGIRNPGPLQRPHPGLPWCEECQRRNGGVAP